MSYSTGILKHRVTILKRSRATVGQYGKDSAGISWTPVRAVWAAVDYSRGTHSMREGALDAYQVIMVRMRYNGIVNPRCRIGYNGLVYQIIPDTFHAEEQENTIQFNAQLVVESYDPPILPK